MSFAFKIAFFWLSLFLCAYMQLIKGKFGASDFINI